jgi:hypothetical protein
MTDFGWWVLSVVVVAHRVVTEGVLVGLAAEFGRDLGAGPPKANRRYTPPRRGRRQK